MDARNANQHISHISTLWTLVYKAHGGSAESVSTAQRVLLERYGGSVYRYLLGALRDPDAADDLFQEFSLRLLRGDFKNANPERGRFRDFLKTSVYHLVIDYHKRKQRPIYSFTPGVHEPAVNPPSVTESEQAFLTSWREELMDRTWLALESLEKESGQPHHTVLRMRTDYPDLRSEELAVRVGERLGKPFRIDALRQALHRARDKFTDLLLEEIVQSLENPTPDRLEEELTDLGLATYCQKALERRCR